MWIRRTSFLITRLLVSGLGEGDECEVETRLLIALTGIHGRPYKAWDGVGIGPPGSGGGYCPHGSNLFPTWHRPYLALMEVTFRRR